MHMETRRLLLRLWEETDAAELYRHASDPAVGPAAGWPVHTDVEDSRRIIREVLSAPETYAVVLKETGLPVGSIGLLRGENANAPVTETEAELGYWIGRPLWGLGLIPEASEALLEHAFRDLECTAVWCSYYRENAQSRRVTEKLGFRYHHTVENEPVPLLGEQRTAVYTRMTRAEWERR